MGKLKVEKHKKRPFATSKSKPPQRSAHQHKHNQKQNEFQHKKKHQPQQLQKHYEDEPKPLKSILKNKFDPKTATTKEKAIERVRRKKHKFDFEKNSRTIFVGNLPKEMTQKDVCKLFQDCGTVESARIRSVIPEKETLGPKVALLAKKIHPKIDSFNAYVVFNENENDSCVSKALKLNGKDVDGHKIRVDRASQPNSKRLTLTSRKKSVFVGNLRFDSREDDLVKYFQEKAGDVDYVRLIRDSASGVGKGFGFVVFKERATVKKALELNGTQIRGRPLRVTKVEAEDGKKGSKNKKADKPGKKESKKEGRDHKEERSFKVTKKVVKGKKPKNDEDSDVDEDEFDDDESDD